LKLIGVTSSQGSHWREGHFNEEPPDRSCSGADFLDGRAGARRYSAPHVAADQQPRPLVVAHFTYGVGSRL